MIRIFYKVEGWIKLEVSDDTTAEEAINTIKANPEVSPEELFECDSCYDYESDTEILGEIQVWDGSQKVYDSGVKDRYQDFDKEYYEELRKAYGEAVETGDFIINFKGSELLISYAKYLLEFLESKIKKD